MRASPSRDRASSRLARSSHRFQRAPARRLDHARRKAPGPGRGRLPGARLFAAGGPDSGRNGESRPDLDPCGRLAPGLDSPHVSAVRDRASGGGGAGKHLRSPRIARSAPPGTGKREEGIRLPTSGNGFRSGQSDVPAGRGRDPRVQGRGWPRSRVSSRVRSGGSDPLERRCGRKPKAAEFRPNCATGSHCRSGRETRRHPLRGSASRSVHPGSPGGLLPRGTR
jgi:hypothetical protein